MSFELNHISKKYADKKVFSNFSASFSGTGITCFVGDSGCGKTTLFRMVSGLTKIDKGQVINVPKKISFIFQEDRLLPWTTVFDNILAVKNNPNQSDNDRIKCLLNMVQLSDVGSEYPNALSGGMRQRINIIRALFYDFDLLLMDEPLKGLEIALKRSIINIIINELGMRPAFLITHDLSEALLMANEIVVVEGIPFNIKKRILVSEPISDRNEDEMMAKYKNLIL